MIQPCKIYNLVPTNGCKPFMGKLVCISIQREAKFCSATEHQCCVKTAVEHLPACGMDGLISQTLILNLLAISQKRNLCSSRWKAD